jgi:hypothetical protein
MLGGAGMSKESQRRVQKAADAASAKSTDPTRHKCFITYHVDDEKEVTDFLDTFGDVFIGTCVGVTDDDDFVDSDDTDYIMNQIREKYLGNTTVTIGLIGKCTWARKYVDWEIYSSLRKYKDYPLSGLMAITLPSAADYADRRLPARLDDNVDGDKGYARWWKYPSSKTSLKGLIQEAYDARTSKANLIKNSRDRRQNNASC